MKSRFTNKRHLALLDNPSRDRIALRKEPRLWNPWRYTIIVFFAVMLLLLGNVVVLPLLCLFFGIPEEKVIVKVCLVSFISALLLPFIRAGYIIVRGRAIARKRAKISFDDFSTVPL